MPLKFYKPTTSGRRHASVDAFSDVTKYEPEKALVVIKKKTGGRNSQGKVTVRHRGGGAKRYIRLIDFYQNRYDESAKVVAIEYDPNRGARLALLQFSDGEKRYIVAPHEVKVGDQIVSSQNKVDIKNGNRMPLKHMPVGLTVHNIELLPKNGGKLVRGAGLGAQLLALDGGNAQLKMPSGEIRIVGENCAASVGLVSNSDHRLVRLGSAGRKRLLGWRPEVRGKAMNPVDHPHGGGEGKNAIGLKYPKTKWGKHALGVKTRKRNRWSNVAIIARRKK